MCMYSFICVYVCETESLPRLLKEIMQEAKRLTDAEWCVIISLLYFTFLDLYLVITSVVQVEHLVNVCLDNSFQTE